jgi:hypothetical protein
MIPHPVYDTLDRHDRYATVDRLDRTDRAATKGRGRGLWWSEYWCSHQSTQKSEYETKK